MNEPRKCDYIYIYIVMHELYIFIMEYFLFSHKKEGNADIYDNMDESGGHYAK